MSNPEHKIQTLKQYLRQNPHDSFTKFALALEFLKLDQSDKAKKLFESIRSRDPDYVGVYYHLGKLHEQHGNTDQARQIYDEGIQKAREQGESRTLSELQEAKSILAMDKEE